MMKEGTMILQKRMHGNDSEHRSMTTSCGYDEEHHVQAPYVSDPIILMLCFFNMILKFPCMISLKVISTSVLYERDKE